MNLGKEQRLPDLRNWASGEEKKVKSSPIKRPSPWFSCGGGPESLTVRDTSPPLPCFPSSLTLSSLLFNLVPLFGAYPSFFPSFLHFSSPVLDSAICDPGLLILVCFDSLPWRVLVVRSIPSLPYSTSSFKTPVVPADFAVQNIYREARTFILHLCKSQRSIKPIKPAI